MIKPVLVIMAAGMGSRYGGLKQIDPIDEQGHIIMDFSIFDAKRAGFEKVVFIIKKENEADFREADCKPFVRCFSGCNNYCNYSVVFSNNCYGSWICKFWYYETGTGCRNYNGCQYWYYGNFLAA